MKVFFRLLAIVGLAVFTVNCDSPAMFYDASSNRVLSTDLSKVIPAPVADEAPVSSIAYTGEYVVGPVEWTENGAAVSGNFETGKVYQAAFFLIALNRTFAGMPDWVWTAGQGPQSICFYYTGAQEVIQNLNTGTAIRITITFNPAQGQSATPTGAVLFDIDAGAEKVIFQLTSTNDGTWKVYDAPSGGSEITSTVWASFNPQTRLLTLESMDSISPRPYWVSVTEPGKGESGRLQLWDTPVYSVDAKSIAERFNIPVSALPTGANGVSALFNVLHAYIRDVRAQTLASPYTVPKIVLGDWIDLPSLEVKADAVGGGFSGGPYRLIIVGNNSFHSRGTYDPPDAAAKAHNNGTPHLVFQFKDIPVQRRMLASVPSATGYTNSEMRDYLLTCFFPGLRDAGVPNERIFAPQRYVKDDIIPGDPNMVIEDDTLWLPGVWELSGTNAGAYYEDGTEQAQLEYYNSDERRTKVGGSGRWWTSCPNLSDGSTSATNGFRVIGDNGDAAGGTESSSSPQGVAPAFCVK